VFAFSRETKKKKRRWSSLCRSLLLSLSLSLSLFVGDFQRAASVLLLLLLLENTYPCVSVEEDFGDTK